jgi:hypothetical protein
MTTLELRNVPTDFVRAVLIDRLRGVSDGDAVSGEGWRVRLRAGAPVRLGLTTVPVLFLDVDGERESEVAAFLRRNTLRGGG